MEITILGSGGAITPPILSRHQAYRLNLQDKIVFRTGPSVFLRKIHALFDTPADIRLQLLKNNIRRIDHLFLSHWHPDHTEGIRILEMLNTNFLHKNFPNCEHKNLTTVYLSEETLKMHRKVINLLDYLVSMNIARISLLKEPIILGDIRISPVFNKYMTYYHLANKKRAVAYLPCELMDLDNVDFPPFDILIAKLPWQGTNRLKRTSTPGHWRYGKDNFNDLLRFIKKHKPERTILTHIEDIWGLDRQKMDALVKRYQSYNLEFSWDGMNIEL